MNFFAYLSAEVLFFSYLTYLINAIFWFPGMVTLLVSLTLSSYKFLRKETNV